jgi:hypothetical protein
LKKGLVSDRENSSGNLTGSSQKKSPTKETLVQACCLKKFYEADEKG